ncbi:hypothetical protein FPZ24_01890 [Sphingomonas panacisoli]|uniref:Uncharacterized protein n=1 Tax=Sphingomonas panacisoli TaxID=1813879 RepID=A0A5B8LF58_9SPHN|nr:hypothetical protein [Sphingomonas panacisoli]QDZ06375.1 hypothetical protein FPZ24_01890 [Sphingomonas panacisoli]
MNTVQLPQPSLQTGVYTAVIGLFAAAAVIWWPNQLWVADLIAGAAATVLVWGIKIGGKHWWKTCRKTATLVAVLIVLVTGVAVYRHAQGDEPAVQDFTIAFLPQPLDANGFHAAIVVTSTARKTVVFDAVRIASPGSVTSGGPAIEVTPKRPVSIPFDAGLWRGGIVTFEAHYSVEGKPAKKAIYAEFSVPSNPGPNEIQSNFVREQDKSDFETLQTEADKIGDSAQGCVPVEIPEKLPDGSPTLLSKVSMRRFFLFDANVRQIGMRSLMRGKWYQLSMPLGNTLNGMHEVRYCWHEPNGYMAIQADGRFVRYRIAVGFDQGETQ